ncbi:putative F-box associated interaction domain-containing protein [Helianthus anomalus]
MIVSPSQTVQNSVLIRVDETFPRTSFPLPLSSVPKIAENRLPHVVGACNGLVFLQGWRPEPPGCVVAKHDRLGRLVAVLWNPCIWKSKVIRVPKLSDWPFQTVIGLGSHPHNFDPRVVKIDHVPATRTRWKIQVYSLRSGIWNDIAALRVHSQIVLTSYQMTIDDHIYFLAFRFETRPRDLHLSILINFDLTTQTYSKVLFPNALARSDITAVGLSQLNGDPVVIQEPELMLYSVWQMDRHLKFTTYLHPMLQYICCLASDRQLDLYSLLTPQLMKTTLCFMI